MAIKHCLWIIVILSIISAPPVHAAEHPPDQFATWLHDLEDEAVTQGISRHTVQSALDTALLDERVIELDHKQPEQTIGFDEYVKHTLTPQRIEQGHQLLIDNAAILNQIADQYGVPAPVIVALWGMESSFGKFSGHFNTIDSLLTLAFEGRRAAFFRAELLDALRILDREHLPATALRGSWAGAMGQCQFMPSTYLHYAVDYDGNGVKDIWSSPPDVWASIAHYLASEGWQPTGIWGTEATLDKEINANKIGLDQHYSLSEWYQMGVRPVNNKAPELDQQASLIQPDGGDGRSFLIYDNYRALMRWNRSTYFATTVGLLADRIK